MKTSTELLVERLERIAKANGDVFTYWIDINLDDKGFYYSFVVISIRLNEVFSRHGGHTQSDAALESENNLYHACENASYKNVE